MQEKEIKYQGKKLFYRTNGEGPVVVLLHGFGEDGTVWKNQYDTFPGFTLIVPDLPGSGRSEMIEDMSIEGMAEAVREIIQAAPYSPLPILPTMGEGISTQPSLVLNSNKNLSPQLRKVSDVGSSPVGGSWKGAGRAVLIGHSMGGYITLAFAEKYPELLKSFGLFHSSAYADTEQKKETRKKGIEFIQKHGAYEFLKTSVPDLYSPLTQAQNPEKIDEHLASVRNFSGDTLVKYYEAMIQRPDRTNVLKATNMPVLFILGKNDTAIPLQDGLQQCHMPEISYIHILEDAGHMGMIEYPEVSNNILLTFLKNTQLTDL